jgi:hypothetical protein
MSATTQSRRFPAPWSVEEQTACFVASRFPDVLDCRVNGQSTRPFALLHELREHH